MKPSCKKNSFLKPTYTGCMVSAYGLHALAKHGHEIGVPEFSPGKVRSDPIEIFIDADVLLLVYHCIFCQQMMEALWVVTYKIHASKVSLQTLQVITGSANVGSFQDTKKKFIDVTKTALVKRRRSAHPLYNATFSFKQELTFLRSCGEGIFNLAVTTFCTS